MKSSDPLFIENLFRPIYEVNSAASWVAGGIATPVLAGATIGATSMFSAVAIGVWMCLYGAHTAMRAKPLLDKQMALNTNTFFKMNVSELRERNQLKARRTGALTNDKYEAYLGSGFQWGAEHANRAYQVMDMDTAKTNIELPFFARYLVDDASEETEELGGKPWIHGIGDEGDVYTRASNWWGHSIVFGNVGCGKTTLLKLMALNALHTDEHHIGVTIVVDPKNDEQLKGAIKQELEYLGHEDKFYCLHPNRPSQSCRVPLLKNYNRLTEVAERIAPLMAAEGGSKPYQDFAYDKIYKAARAMDYLGEPIRLTTLTKVVCSDRDGIALRVLDKYYREVVGEDYLSKLNTEFQKLSPVRLEQLAQYYSAILVQEHPNDVVDEMINFALHEKSHYDKMTASLVPVMTALVAPPFDDLLSPMIDIESQDQRDIIDLNDLCQTGGVLYVSLDALADNKSSGYLSQLICSEVASIASKRYNSGEKDSLRVNMFVDEVHSAISDPLLNSLAIGRAAGLSLVLATQCYSDIEAKTDKATANRFLGLCNNFITMRTTDPATQDYASLQFSKSSVTSAEIRTGVNTSTESSITSFSSSKQETLSKSREEAFPPNLFGDLPKLQFMARLADGKRLKMKLPIILNDDEPGEIAEWVQQ